MQMNALERNWVASHFAKTFIPTSFPVLIPFLKILQMKNRI
jgi:hypothetical protein